MKIIEDREIDEWTKAATYLAVHADILASPHTNLVGNRAIDRLVIGFTRVRDSREGLFAVAAAEQRKKDDAVEEIKRLRAGLEMMAQMLSGNARWHVKMAAAILAGTDCRVLEQVEAIR